MISAQYSLTILLVTYNHEKYILQALKSLSEQIFEGTIEVIVADDCSTDETLSIIRAFAVETENFSFKFLESTVNVGITKNYARGFAACTGEFVAVLEGDDYWISPDKLRLQVDFLRSHLECNLCSTNYYVLDEARAMIKVRTPIVGDYRLIGVRELIADNLVGNFSTCVYRRQSLINLPEQIFDLLAYDWIINISVSYCSFIGFIDLPMSIYRVHNQGVWSKTSHIEKLRTQLSCLDDYDKVTNRVYHDDFQLLASRLRNDIAASRLEDSVPLVIKEQFLTIRGITNYIPPIILLILRLIIPPKILNWATRCFAGRSHE